MTDETFQVDLSAGLGEGEVVWTETGAHGTEHGAGKSVDGALEVTHGDALVDAQSLDLMEDWKVSGIVLIGTEHLARADNAHRRLLLKQGVDLHRTGSCAHALTVINRVEPQRVLQGTSRVISAKVQSVEVEPLDSASGPSATSQPIAVNTSQTLSIRAVIGCGAP